jgi:hypothetical protein
MQNVLHRTGKGTQAKSLIPPLSQSIQGDMGCSLLYWARHVEGIEFETEPARRGKEIHKILAEYMDALRITKQQTDYKKMAELSADASPEAKEVLDRFTAANFYDSEKIYDTEVYVAIDDDFQILEVHGQSDRSDKRRVKDAAYHGTMDVIIMESETEATIIDFKSYWQIVDADTFQSKMYPLLLFLLNPQIQKITFMLSFVRYGDAQREVVWTRDDIPKLKKLADWERSRQVSLHSEEPDKLKATPGRQCTWCPLLLSGCPMRKVNAYGTLTPAERVALAVWMNAAKKHNDQVVKDWLLEGGVVEYRDANDVRYTAEFRRQDRKSFPLGASFVILNRWFEAHPGDRDLSEKLTVSGLSSPLKAQKRAVLKTAMEEVAQINVITRLTIGRPGEKEEEE